MVTQDFAKSGTGPFVTGVMYDDKNGNDFYSVGRRQVGHSGRRSAGMSTASLSAGGYQIKAPSGFVTAKFGSAIVFKVDTSKGNAKVDLVDGSILDSSASLEIVAGIHHARLLGIGKANLTGSTDGDWLEGNGGRNRIRGEDGNDTLKGGNGRDKLFGDDGNDNLNAGRGKDKLDGGAGSDVLKGGKGGDTFIFKHGLVDDPRPRLPCRTRQARFRRLLRVGQSGAGGRAQRLRQRRFRSPRRRSRHAERRVGVAPLGRRFPLTEALAPGPARAISGRSGAADPRHRDRARPAGRRRPGSPSAAGRRCGSRSRDGWRRDCPSGRRTAD